MYWFQPSLNIHVRNALHRETWSYVPRGHERKHHKRLAHCRVVLIVSFGRVPFGQAEDLQEKNGKEDEEDEPKRKQTQDDG